MRSVIAVIGAGIVAVGVLATASGCTAPSPESTDEISAEMLASYVELRDDAIEYGASPEQVATLDAAIDSGTRVSFEQYKAAKNLEIGCIEGLGFDIVELRETRRAGWVEIEYMYGGFSTSAEGTALLDDADHCMNRHALFIELAYQTPRSIEEREALREAHRDELVACLREDGVYVADDATWGELVRLDREHARAPDDRICYEELELMEIE